MLARASTLRATSRNVYHPSRRAPEVDHCRLIPLSRPAKWLGYQPIDIPGTKMYHPSNRLPCTANTWEYVAVHEKQQANRVAIASHGELPRLPLEGRKEKAETQEKEKPERRPDTRVPRGRETRHTCRRCAPEGKTLF
ncbi:hypothetical protein AVEN_32347-1 [Araneus ventricosus]|uniref:Uncharacterized protein n=1 Tax=Araneus ventricosus TaxID=182803 RepID=A0A4Y2FME5_ARAVE|nr:hypothetical protein AVEN_32347-1 [Araneus ventricosus]